MTAGPILLLDKSLPVLLFVCLLVFIFTISKKKIVRVEGIILLLLYAADVAFAIIR